MQAEIRESLIFRQNDYKMCNLSCAKRDCFHAELRVTIKAKINIVGKLVRLSSKVCSVTYLDFLHARTMHDGTSDIKVSGRIYLVEFSVSHETSFL